MTANPDLRVEGMTVRFGGLVAVDGVDLHAPAGTITGLIGPNGAGKTTTFNACTGLVTAAEGSVHLGDRRLDRLAPGQRAQAGLGRSFQRIELFDAMTVAENVAMGREAMLAGARPWALLRARRAEVGDIADHASAAIARCDIGDLADRRAGGLSTGQRRLVELARALATGFRFLLLDEPSSGLDVRETERFGDVLAGFVAETGTGVLLVEHDMALVRRLCTTVSVLEFGRLVAVGPTDVTLASDTVRAAYLGTEEVGAA